MKKVVNAWMEPDEGGGRLVLEVNGSRIPMIAMSIEKSGAAGDTSVTIKIPGEAIAWGAPVALGPGDVLVSCQRYERL